MKTSIIKITLYAIARKAMYLCCSLAFTAFMSSCNNEDDAAPKVSTEDQEAANFETSDSYYFEDSESVAMEAFEKEKENTNGKIALDGRLSGAIVVRTGTLLDGTLSIDFGAGTTDAFGNIRKGMIIIRNIGRWNELGAQWTITFSGYSINGVTIEGIREVTVTSVTELVVKHEVELINGKLTWPDGRISLRDSHYTRERDYHSVLVRLIVYGDAQGTTRNGRGYSVEITTPLVYERSCIESGVFIAVKGTKVITHGNRKLTIDYGDGTCDNIVTLTTKAGVSVTYEVSK